MILRSVFEWLSLILLLGLGVYTMWVIKNEKKTYLKNAKEIHFAHFKLLIPSWWTECSTDSKKELAFKRTDAQYDWEARFSWNQGTEEIDLIELFKKQISQRKILFDQETSIIYRPEDFKAQALIASARFEMLRLEGTATAEEQNRIYYDAYIIREKETGAFLYAESKSSVLNGLIEGPYFEEVLNRIELV